MLIVYLLFPFQCQAVSHGSHCDKTLVDFLHSHLQQTSCNLLQCSQDFFFLCAHDEDPGKRVASSHMLSGTRAMDTCLQEINSLMNTPSTESVLRLQLRINNQGAASLVI